MNFPFHWYPSKKWENMKVFLKSANNIWNWLETWKRSLRKKSCYNDNCSFFCFLRRQLSDLKNTTSKWISRRKKKRGLHLAKYKDIYKSRSISLVEKFSIFKRKKLSVLSAFSSQKRRKLLRFFRRYCHFCSVFNIKVRYCHFLT